jgi:hypothetical protein
MKHERHYVILQWEEVLAYKLQVPLYLRLKRAHNIEVPTWHRILLATLLVFGIRISRSAGCMRSAQAQRIKDVLLGLKIKRAGISFFSGKDSATEQRND